MNNHLSEQGVFMYLIGDISLEERQRLRGLLPVRNRIPDIGDVRRRVQHPPPEFEPAAGLVVSHQIGCDLHEPRCSTGSPPEPFARLISLHKTVLRQVLGGFPVAQRCQDESKNSRPVQPDQRIEIFQHLRAAFAGQ